MSTVKKISVSNFEGVDELVLYPEGSHLVQITGGNGAGKSSFLNAVASIIESRGVKFTPKPIRVGADMARAEIVTDEVKLVRIWKKDDAGKLEAFATDGAKYPSGLDVVKRLTGGQLFEPYAFVNLSEKAQRDELLRHVDLDVDLDDLSKQRGRLFDQRTEVNREVKRLEGALDSMPDVPDDTPNELVSVAELSRRLSAAENARREYSHWQSKCFDIIEDIGDIERQIEQLKIELQEKQAEREVAAKWLDDHSELPNVDGIRAQLEAADSVNENVRTKQRRNELEAERDEKLGKADILTEQIRRADQSKETALASAQFPVPGMSVDDDQILVDGVPFKQVNTAEQIAASFALATSGDRDLRLVIIREGSLLDDVTLERIRKVAEERDYLVLVECVSNSDQVGFVIDSEALA